MVHLRLSPSRNALLSWWQPAVAAKEKPEQANGTIPGLANLGNTCFMNAVLQCIANSPGWLAEACRSCKHLESLGGQATERPSLRRGIEEFLREYNSTEGKPLTRENSALRNIKQAIATLDRQYAGCEQQDAYEFFGCLLDGLEENLKALSNSTSDPVSPEGDSENTPADLIRAICGVSSHTERRCHKCSGCFEVDKVTDFALRVPLVSPAAEMDADLREKEEHDPISLEELLKATQEPEDIEGYDCDVCRERAGKIGDEHQYSSMTQRFSILSGTRDILVVVLYRFCRVLDDNGCSKTMKVRRDVASPSVLSVDGVDFNLFGIVSHIGSDLTTGHYIAAVQSSRDGLWYECDDDRVKTLNTRALYDGRPVTATREGADPYMLFYRRAAPTTKADIETAECCSEAASSSGKVNTSDQQAEISIDRALIPGDRVLHFSGRLATVESTDVDGDPLIRFDGEPTCLLAYRSQVEIHTSSCPPIAMERSSSSSRSSQGIPSNTTVLSGEWDLEKPGMPDSIGMNDPPGATMLANCAVSSVLFTCGDAKSVATEPTDIGDTDEMSSARESTSDTLDWDIDTSANRTQSVARPIPVTKAGARLQDTLKKFAPSCASVVGPGSLRSGLVPMSNTVDLMGGPATLWVL